MLERRTVPGQCQRQMMHKALQMPLNLETKLVPILMLSKDAAAAWQEVVRSRELRSFTAVLFLVPGKAFWKKRTDWNIPSDNEKKYKKIKIQECGRGKRFLWFSPYSIKIGNPARHLVTFIRVWDTRLVLCTFYVAFREEMKRNLMFFKQREKPKNLAKPLA